VVFVAQNAVQLVIIFVFLVLDRVYSLGKNYVVSS